MAVINVRNLGLSFGENTVFSDVSFEIGEKEKVGFIGVNGAGKSSLFKILTGELEAVSGSCCKARDAKIGYMQQHTCTEGRTVYEELISVFSHLMQMELELERLHESIEKRTGNLDEDIKRQAFLIDEYNKNGGLTYKSRTKSALLGLGFTERDFGMSTEKLSGGQRSKLILAKLLLSQADLLLLDEPTNHLDIQAAEWLEGFLKDFPGAALIISHDRYFLDKVTDKTIELEHGKIRSYKGGYSEFLKKKEAAQKAVEDKYYQDLKEIERINGIIAQQKTFSMERNYKTIDSKLKQIERIKEQIVVPDKEVEKIRFDFSPSSESGNDVLFVNGLGKSFGDKNIFENASFEVKKGERIFLVGANGCGKTTLLKILTKDYPDFNGKFSFGTGVTVGYFDQVQDKLDLSKTVLDEVWDSFPRMDMTSIRKALAGFLFKGDDVNKVLRSCSGGERARVALLKLMLGRYNFLLLDEPTNHLDTFSREALEKTLSEYEGTMLIVSHDRYFINKLATKIIELTPSGINEYTGDYDAYFEKKNEPAQTVREKTVSAGADSYRQRKEKQSQIRKLKTKIRNAEANIEALEKQSEELELLISGGEISDDYEKLLETSNLINEVKNRIEEEMLAWEQAGEALMLLEEE
ncbi:MAG: ABC-F family ATP-binding cassette domain-containing protein [Oscillospiraceae bacterium]